MTAFGVGELSAINAVAGAFAERSPVVHIVGTPSTTVQHSGLSFHHSLGNGDHRVFANMYASITVAQTNLSEASTAVSEIDRVLETCLTESRPVYIELPTDMITRKVSVKADFGNNITASLMDVPSGNSSENEVVQLIFDKICTARYPFIFVDGLVRAFHIQDEVNTLVGLTGIPTTVTPFGKGTLNETLPNVLGMYNGPQGHPAYHAFVQNSDLILRFTRLESEVNTFQFSTITKPAVTIFFDQRSITINGERCPVTSLKHVLGRLIHKISSLRHPLDAAVPDVRFPVEVLRSLPASDSDKSIDQQTFWLRMSSFLREGDTVLSECGTSGMGSREMILPERATMISSALWMSIGSMLGAAQGAAFAQRDLRLEDHRQNGRTILFIGDGSLQMSVQVISDIIRNRLDLIIFIINNNGYTIERFIHGMDAHYNDVQPWRYLEAPSFFGADLNDPKYPIVLRQATTWGEMGALLKDPVVTSGQGLVMMEVMMGKSDAPEALKKMFPATKS